MKFALLFAGFAAAVRINQASAAMDDGATGAAANGAAATGAPAPLPHDHHAEFVEQGRRIIDAVNRELRNLEGTQH